MSDPTPVPEPTEPQQHERLTEALASDDLGVLLAIAFDARAAAENGRYCTCVEPLTVGAGLLCGACLLNNKDQERAAVHRLVDAHDFVPSDRFELMCEVCTNWEDNERHHGVGSLGRTSWGEDVRGRSRA